MKYWQAGVALTVAVMASLTAADTAAAAATEAAPASQQEVENKVEQKAHAAQEAAQKAESDLQDRVANLTKTVDTLVDRLQHQGSTGYWQKFGTDQEKKREEAMSAPADTLKAKLLSLQQRLARIDTQMSADDAGSRGTSVYWQNAKSQDAGALVKPVSAVAQARSCIGDAGVALATAADHVENSQEKAKLVDQQMSEAQDKLKCALEHFSVDQVHGGSAEYWALKSKKFDAAVMHDRWTVVAGCLLVCLLVAGSVASIVSLSGKDSDEEPSMSEPLL